MFGIRELNNNDFIWYCLKQRLVSVPFAGRQIMPLNCDYKNKIKLFFGNWGYN